MLNFVFAFLTVCFFCFCAHQFIKSVLTPLPLINYSSYNKSALRVEKYYKSFSWGVMTFVFLIALVVSFVQVYTQI